MQTFLTKPHDTNREAMEKIFQIRDEDGKFPLNQTDVSFLCIISAFSHADGCYMKWSNILQRMGGSMTEQTLKRHAKYLLHIGVLSRTRENARWRFRVKNPCGGVVQSQKMFRYDQGFSAYSYLGQKDVTKSLEQEKNDPLMDEIFLSKQALNFTNDGGANLPSKEDNFTPPVVRSNQILRQIDPPKAPLVFPNSAAGMTSGSEANGGIPSAVGKTEAGVDPTRGGNDEVSKSGQVPRNDGPLEHEPLARPRRGRGPKRPKNRQEARAEAKALLAKEHIARPTGRPPAPSRCQWATARDVDFSSTNNVSLPQLTKVLVLKYADAFGSEDIVVNMLAMTNPALSSFYGDLKQAFIENTSHDPSYRDLAEYFCWFLDPARCGRLLNITKYGADTAPHVKMLKGKVFIRKFFDEVLSRKKQAEVSLVTVSMGSVIARAKTQAFLSAYEQISSLKDDENELVFCLAKYGFVIVAQYFHDELGMDESACKQHIITLLVRHLKKHSADPEQLQKAKNYVNGIWERTKKNQSLYENCMWAEFEAKAGDLLEVAFEQAGV